MDSEIAVLFSLFGWAIGGAAVLLSLGTAVFLWLRIESLDRQVRHLRLQLAERPVPSPAPQVRVEPVAAEVPATIDAPAPEPTVVEAPAPAVLPHAPEVPPRAPVPRPVPMPKLPSLSLERLVVWGAVAMGGFMVIVGVLFALVTVMRTGWFGPGARIAMAMVAGTAFWVAGAAIRGRLRAFPAALEGIGSSTLFGTVFAAFSIYGLLGPTVTFGLFVFIALVAGLRAAVHDDRIMAYLGLIGGLLAPALISSGNNGALGLFAYLALLLAGVLGVAARRRWPDLVLAASLGSASLYTGWTVSWYAADSVWMAHLGAVALTIPFAWVAWRSQGTEVLDVATRWAGVLGALVWPLVALPWLVPVGAHFVDPRSGLVVVRSGTLLAVLAVVTPALLGLPLALAARLRRDPWVGTVAVGVATVAGLTAAVGWSSLEYHRLYDGALMGDLRLLGPLDVVALIAILPLLALSGVFAGARRTGVALPALLLPAAVVSTGMAGVADGPRFGVTVILLTLLAVGAAYTSTSGGMLLALVGVLTIALGTAAFQPSELGLAWVIAPTLVALGLVPLAGLARTWRDDPLPALGWLGALLVVPALFLPVVGVWEVAFGLDAIGLVPILLGVVSLISTGVLVRRHRTPNSSPLLGLAIALTMAGVTFALPMQFETKWLTVGWALEALALAAIAKRLPQPLLRAGAVGLGVIVAVRLLLNPWSLSYGDAGGWPIVNWTLYTWGIPTLCLIGVASLLGESTLSKASAVLLRILAMFTAFALVNVEVSHAFQDAGPIELGGQTMLQGMVRSISWGIYGLGLLGVGLVVRSRYTRFFGFAFILLAASKVLVYDLWALPGFVRVGSLIGLGLILLVSALLFERLVLRGPEEEA